MNSIKQYEINGMSFIEIDNNSGFKVTLTDFGASIFTIYFNDELMNVQVEDPNVFLNSNVRYGKTIGRVAGRIPEAKYHANGKIYNVIQNEGLNCLHGGDCFAQRFFDIKSVSNNPNRTKVVMHYKSNDGELGFGGKLDVDVIYRVKSNASILDVEYQCVCDKDCPINVTNHTYYSLGDDSINNLTLYVNSNRYAKPRSIDLIPESISSVPKYLNFTKPKLLCKDIDDPAINKGRLNGYDHFLLFNEVDSDIKQVILKNDRYTLTLYTDYEGAQFYTNNNSKPIKCLNSGLTRRRGVAIEPQTSILTNNIMIKANHPINHTISLHFSKNK